MSSKKNPRTIDKPPLVDPHHVPEVFANEFISASVAPGITGLTFAVQRLTEGERPDQPPRLERVVVSRLVLSHVAVKEMINQLIGLDHAMKQQSTLAKAKTETVN